MINLNNINGLMFWSEEEIRLRELVATSIVSDISLALKKMNRSFEIIRCEAPILSHIDDHAAYDKADYYQINYSDLALRPETTKGSYLYAKRLLNSHNERKVLLPLCVWQHGKSFRREQDQVIKNMRLKEFYQLEFQILFSDTTKHDYYKELITSASNAINRFCFIDSMCDVIDSDRLPKYSAETKDIMIFDLDKHGLEIASISRRTDYPQENIKVIEIAIGTDRIVSLMENC